MITHKIRSTVSQLSLITFLAVLICASPLFASDCSVQSLTGFYGFVITGDRSGSPVTIAGEMAADGSGSLSGLETISQNGSILDSAEILGNYTINSNCTGKLAIQGQGRPEHPVLRFRSYPASRSLALYRHRRRQACKEDGTAHQPQSYFR